MNVAVRTTCPYCGVGCGVRAVQAKNGWNIDGDPQHPANLGRLCSKGAALGETLGLDGRLLAPQINGTAASWDDALDHVARGFKDIIAKHGPDAVAFYVSGQLLTEDYYVANKLMKGFIGSANIDTNSRLCMSSAVAAHKRAFGADLVPVCYEDLELADMIVLVGSNTAWCHPILYQRILRARQQRPELKIVVIDPRRTATCEIADLHLPVSSGSDVWLFNGLLVYLHQHGIMDTGFVEGHTRGATRALLVAENTAGSVSAVAKACGVSPALIEEFYRLFARHERVITAFSQGVNQSSQGTDKASSIINCHLLTGRIGKAGAGPFSITGQPNAMGGREVGGMANMLAAHLDLEDAGHRSLVQEFWQSPTIATRPGLKAVDLFKAIGRGQVKAVWIMATNPVVSMPDANKVRAALQRCELVVSSDCVANTDTNALAHVLLPASGWGEKDGTVTNSERRISRQRAFLPAAAEARPDWWIICQVAQRMGFRSGFNFDSPQEIFVEHAQLSATQNAGERAFNLGGLSGLDQVQYDALDPIQWPVTSAQAPGLARMFTERRYYHSDGRARFVATKPHAPAHARTDEYPLVLNTGRIRDQWHTMTRTGRAPRLTDNAPEPFVDMHPQDALLAGVRENELARVSTRWGELIARVRMSGAMPRRMLFVPIHWSQAFSSDARVGALVNPVVDPHSGEPEFKHTPARVAPFVVSWQGFILSRKPVAVQDLSWWTVIQGKEFQRYEIAGRRVHGNWSRWARALLGATAESDWLEYGDVGTGIYRAIHVVDERIESCLFLSPRADLPSRSWLAGLFAKQSLSAAERAGMLAGRSREAQEDAGPTVCSCFGVGRNTICRAILAKGLQTAQQIGHHLRAGTNCGSCVSELNTLLTETKEAAAST